MGTNQFNIMESYGMTVDLEYVNNLKEELRTSRG